MRDEIVSSRAFPVQPGELYAAFADPVRLARWWGPHGSRNEFHAFDLRPGGAWRFTMRAPDGAAYAMDKTFVDVVPGERVVLRHAQSGHDFVMAMTYEPVAEGTRLVWRVRFADAAQLAAVEKAFAAANEENFDRLRAEIDRGP